MKKSQALIEAKRRWAHLGTPRVAIGIDITGKREKRVGYVAMGMFFSVQGHGPTWEAAFERADKQHA